MTAQELKRNLGCFTGSLNWFRHWTKSLIYSEGVNYLAEKAEAHWLIDAIASYVNSPEWQRAIKKNEDLLYMSFWYITVKDNEAVLEWKLDSDEPAIITQKWEYSDFPLEAQIIYMGCDGPDTEIKIYLPSEY